MACPAEAVAGATVGAALETYFALHPPGCGRTSSTSRGGCGTT